MSKKPIYKSKLFYVALAVLAVAGYGMKLKDDKPAPVPAATVSASVTAEPAVEVTDAPTATPAPRPTHWPAYALVDTVCGRGLTVQTGDDGGAIRCDYTLQTTKRASIEWTDGAHVYTVTGDADDLARLYLYMLDNVAWESCLYSVKRNRVAGYGGGIDASKASASLAGYTATVRAALDVKPTPTPAPVKHDYVVNLESKIFHKPGCFQEKRIKGKKRKEVHVFREYMISKGYEPCGNCNP